MHPRNTPRGANASESLPPHWVHRYGIDEVALWPFDCWNEPNLEAFWTAGQAAYFRLYRTTAAALKSVDARLKIGGPVTAGNAWLKDFTAECNASATACDFISTHYYPTDPFGAIDSDTTTQLENSPPGVMRQRAEEAREVAGKLPLYYTEWSISSNPREPFHNTSFAAALAVRIAMSVDGIADGYSYWTFSDIFAENYFPSVPYHGGFGMINLYGVPKPIYRAFQLLRTLGNARIDVCGDHRNVVVWVGPNAARRSTPVVLINQAMPRHAIDVEAVVLRVRNSAVIRPHSVLVTRIDDTHANPLRAWHDMGSPEYPTRAQVATLEQASATRTEILAYRWNDAVLEISVSVAPQSVNHLHIEWEADA